MVSPLNDEVRRQNQPWTRGDIFPIRTREGEIEPAWPSFLYEPAMAWDRILHSGDTLSNEGGAGDMIGDIVSVTPLGGGVPGMSLRGGRAALRSGLRRGGEREAHEASLKALGPEELADYEMKSNDEALRIMERMQRRRNPQPQPEFDMDHDAEVSKWISELHRATQRNNDLADDMTPDLTDLERAAADEMDRLENPDEYAKMMDEVDRIAGASDPRAEANRLRAEEHARKNAEFSERWMNARATHRGTKTVHEGSGLAALAASMAQEEDDYGR